jgi:hypothetical protein
MIKNMLAQKIKKAANGDSKANGKPGASNESFFVFIGKNLPNGCN